MSSKQKTVHPKKIGKVIGAIALGLIATFAMALPAWAGVTIQARADRADGADHMLHVRPGDSFNYTISVSSDQSTSFSDPSLPNLDGFSVSGPSTSSETSATFDNGTVETKQTKTFTYTLAANQEGVYTIGPARVTINGQTYTSNALTVKVDNNAPQAPPTQAGQNPSDDDDDVFNKLLQQQFGGLLRPTPDLPQANSNNLYFIQAVVDKHKVYVGEQVTVTFYLVTRAQIADIDTLKYPDLKGFWKEDIDVATRLNFEPVNVNGVNYQRALLASYALFPIHVGNSIIDPYRTKCSVVVANAMGLPQTMNLDEQSGEIPIEVMPLPEQGKPPNFSGAVGEFTASSTVDSQHTKVGQPVTLDVRLEGEGNAKLADMPKIDLGPNVQVFDPKINMKFYPNGRSFKDFQTLLVPRQPGEMKIPSFDFWFFNPVEKKYYETKTDELSIQVDPGPAQAANSVLPTLTQNNAEPTATQKPEMPGLLLAADDSNATRLSPAKVAGMWAGLWGITVLALGGFAWRELREDNPEESLREKISRRMHELDTAATKEDFRHVGRVAAETIHQVLGEIAGLGGASYEFEKMAEKAPPSFKRELVPQLRTLLSRLEAVAYAPEGMIGQLKEKAELKKLVAETRRILHLASQYDFSSRETRPK